MEPGYYIVREVPPNRIVRVAQFDTAIQAARALRRLAMRDWSATRDLVAIRMGEHSLINLPPIPLGNYGGSQRNQFNGY